MLAEMRKSWYVILSDISSKVEGGRRWFAHRILQMPNGNRQSGSGLVRATIVYEQCENTVLQTNHPIFSIVEIGFLYCLAKQGESRLLFRPGNMPPGEKVVMSHVACQL